MTNMIKKILLISLVSALFLCVPTNSRAQSTKAGIEDVQSSIAISFNESTLHITNAAGMSLQIYNITGVSIGQVQLELQCTLHWNPAAIMENSHHVLKLYSS